MQLVLIKCYVHTSLFKRIRALSYNKNVVCMYNLAWVELKLNLLLCITSFTHLQVISLTKESYLYKP